MILPIVCLARRPPKKFRLFILLSNRMMSTWSAPYSYEFSAKSFNGSWFSNNQIQWRDKENNLVLWNVNTNETTILVGADTVGQVSKTAQFVDFAPKDNSKLLFYDNKKSVWRHSFLANYLILDSKTNETKHIIPKGLTEPTKLQYCQWVPETSWIIFVFENNVYLRKDAYNQEADMQLSKDGVVDTIYNGIPGKFVDLVGPKILCLKFVLIGLVLRIGSVFPDISQNCGTMYSVPFSSYYNFLHFRLGIWGRNSQYK